MESEVCKFGYGSCGGGGGTVWDEKCVVRGRVISVGVRK